MRLFRYPCFGIFPIWTAAVSNLQDLLLEDDGGKATRFERMTFTRLLERLR
ncbi:hypothetical protein [Oscillibacter sp.]|uniref:hypothetical protein n=1 Tax=Oscillibacter sp. TaxID=1945593 RepID=UPI00289B958E|nr:hypothetical protein [Oscillibacter sp.]